MKNVYEIDEKYRKLFVHPLLEPLKNLLRFFFWAKVFKMVIIVYFYSLEIDLIKSLTECHVALLPNLNTIEAIVNLKKINDLFNKYVPQLNAKQAKEVFNFYKNKIKLN